MVETFTSAGPFLYAGFGSMAGGGDPIARGRALLSTTRARGLRLLIARGLGGIDLPKEEIEEDVLVVGSVAHDRVLPRAAAAVHHGGIGTLHAVARSGIVSVIAPFIADQPFWGAMMHRRGLGPAPIPQRRLTPTRLHAALDSVPSYRPSIAAAAAEITQEDGTGDAIGVITGLHSSSSGRHRWS
jgi:sterol 3beta-glucosyltransferase